MKPDLNAFVVKADALVPCKVCGSSEGVPCVGDDLKKGYVHFGRRVKRLLLTASHPEKREKFEDDALRMLRNYLAERP